MANIIHFTKREKSQITKECHLGPRLGLPCTLNMRADDVFKQLFSLLNTRKYSLSKFFLN